MNLLRAVGLMILEPWQSKLLSDVSSSLMSQYLRMILGASFCVDCHPLCVSW